MTRVLLCAAGNLLKIVNDYLRADPLEDFLHELNVEWMDLVIVLGFLVGKGKVQCHLVCLVYHRSLAAHHLPRMKLQHAGNGLEVMESPRQEFLSGIGLRRIGPENDNV